MIKSKSCSHHNSGSLNFEDDNAYNPEELPKWIRTQNWKKIRSLFTNARAQAVQYCQDNDKMLHIAVRFQPPVFIMNLLYDACPQGVFVKSEDLSRYPIHWACRHGASPFVVAFLAKKNPLACGLQDSTGRTPLHIICEYYTTVYDPNEELVKEMRLPSKEALIQGTKLLCKACPESINLEDHEGRAALEVAIEFEAPLSVVKSLQNASELDWKIRASEEQCDQTPAMEQAFNDSFSSIRSFKTHASLQEEMQAEVTTKKIQLQQQVLEMTPTVSILGKKVSKSLSSKQMPRQSLLRSVGSKSQSFASGKSLLKNMLLPARRRAPRRGS